MFPLRLVTLTPPGLPDPSLAIAGSRAGGVGVLDLEYGVHTPAARQAWKDLCRYAGNDIGLKLHSQDQEFLQEISPVPGNLKVVILTHPRAALLKQAVDRLHSHNLQIFAECTSIEEAQLADRAGADGVIAKGHEAGGRTGNETSFILLQRFLQNLSIPVWVQGGIGLHTASACYVAGATGVVLDSQLLLTRESPLPEGVRQRIVNLDGTETVILGAELGELYRVSARMGGAVVKELQETEKKFAGSAHLPETRAAWRQALVPHVGWSSPEHHLLFSGQDIAFAAPLAHRFETVGGILEGIRQAIAANLRAAATHQPLAEGSPLAQSHGTRFPIVQGPMARVSDNADFVCRISQGGALPFVAAAWMRAPELTELLKETKARLQDRAWGVGLLGFLPRDDYAEQLEVIRQYPPPFALIAGGQPHQVKQLEQEGIATYIHVPSPGLLRMFLSEGLNRFVFEGRESGGHVGPLCSFVLFEEMINILEESLAAKKGRREYQVLFAGGIHDAVSAAMIAVMSGALVEQGVRVGVQLGTAYLFADAAVDSGAIVRTYQQEVLNCDGTTLLVAGPGHAERVVETPFAQVFQREKSRQSASGATPEEIRHALDRIKLGRLRAATKGLARNPDHENNPQAPKFVNLSEPEQREQGVYLVGQLAGLRRQVCTIDSLHHDISVQGNTRVDEIWREYAKTLAGPDQAQPLDIAIIGMACLLPKAAEARTYWQNILNKVNAIGEIPPERWDWRLYYDPDLHAPDKVCSKWGAFLDEVWFDPTTYGLPPNSLPSIEPLQLLTLEVTRQALEDAGYSRRPFPRDRTAVILGISGSGELKELYGFRAALPAFFGSGSSDLTSYFKGVLPEWTEDSFPGILMNVAAGRIANRFDLGGTNFTVDAACASSLAAVYLAVRELETRSSDMVIVGAADCMQNPFTFTCFSKTQALSPRGRCQSLGDEADGIVLGEGVVMMVFKRLAAAERDGDRIYAVIKGVGAGSDGKGKSLTAPGREGQVRTLQRAYRQAGVSPATVELIEAHATGTPVGDRTEIEALNQVFSEAGARAHSCAIGSVKSMIGHTKSSAGLASLMKTALALHHKVLPPTLGVAQPNPGLCLPDTPFYVSAEPRPWVGSSLDTPRRAGVSALGFGGTNFHVVLEEYSGDYLTGRQEPSCHEWPSELFIWEADSRQELLDAIGVLEGVLKEGGGFSLGDLAYSLARARKFKAPEAAGQSLRVAVVAASLEDLPDKLSQTRNALTDSPSAIWDPRGIYFAEHPLAPQGKVAFLFPGQGSQYVNMLADLAVQFPEVRELFARSSRLLRDKLPQPLHTCIFPPPGFSDADRRSQEETLAQTWIAQPAVGTADLALFHVLGSLGVHPDMLAGHSYGEYVALCAAGVFGEEDLIALSEARARFIREGVGRDPGGMAAVTADLDAVSRNLEGLAGVWIANVNAPNQVVITGTQDGIKEAVQKFADQGLKAQPIPVSCAFHSPLMKGAAGRLQEFLASLPAGTPSLEVFANTTAAPYPTDPEAVVQILVEHLTSQVQFVAEIEAMYETGARIFVEVGPGNVLSRLVANILGDRPHLAVPSNQSGRSGLVQLHHLLGQLAVHRVAIKTNRIFRGRGLHKIDLKQPGKTLPQGKTSANAWVVSGALARPVKAIPGLTRSIKFFPYPLDHPRHPGPELSAAHREDKTRKLLRCSGVPAAVPNRAPPPATSTSEMSRVTVFEAPAPDAVMVHYQRLMQRFLDTQKQVLMSYLGATAAEGISTPEAAGSLPLRVEAPPPEPVASAPPVSLTPAMAVVPRADQAGPDREELTARLLTIMGERTGYPQDMLDLNLDLEADLGVDSIKRTEIMGYFLQSFFPAEQGGLPREMEEISRSRTMREILDRVESCFRAPQSCEPGAGPGVSGSPLAARTTEAPRPEADLPSRFTLAALGLPVASPAPRLASGRVLVITDDEGGIASALAEKLKSRGWETALVRFHDGDAGTGETGYSIQTWSAGEVAALLESIRRRQGPIGGLIHLLPLKQGLAYADLDITGWRKRLQMEVKSLFLFLKLLEKDIQEALPQGQPLVVAATGMGGSFGSDPDLREREFMPSQGGIPGLLKALKEEWPGVLIKSVDFCPGESATQLADHLMSEIEAEDNLLEVGYKGAQRYGLVLTQAPLGARPDVLRLDSSSVVLVTGGARGITAVVALELARRYQSTFILAGRAPLPPEVEAEETADLHQPRELKAALIAKMQQQGKAVKLTAVEATFQQLLKEREIRTNLAAMRAAGSTVSYFQVDVRNQEAFGDLIEELYRTYGRLNGVIHGAGIIEDKLIKDKTPESFDRVFGTKTESVFVLSRKLQPESLEFLALFSSVAGRIGNRGQGDYGAANEVLNKLGVYLDQRWPGRIVSINWNPWEMAGMVSPEVQRQFAQQGIHLISPDAGARIFNLEILRGRKGEVEVVIGDGPWNQAARSPEACIQAKNSPSLLR